MRISDWSSDVCSSDLLDARKLDKLPSPTPGAGDIRIAVHAAGVNFADTLQIVGKYQHKPPLPFAPGMEVAGEVVAVGEGASHLKPGDRVFAAMRAGAFAEECVVPADHATRIPDGMDYVAAAAFPIVYGTRSEERRVGKECVVTCSSLWSPGQ